MIGRRKPTISSKSGVDCYLPGDVRPRSIHFLCCELLHDISPQAISGASRISQFDVSASIMDTP